MNVYLFYVRKYDIFSNDYKLTIYKCNTNDPFHTVGEIVYRTFEEIKRISFVECADFRERYWREHGYQIYEWHDKYLVKE